MKKEAETIANRARQARFWLFGLSLATVTAFAAPAALANTKTTKHTAAPTHNLAVHSVPHHHVVASAGHVISHAKPVVKTWAKPRLASRGPYHPLEHPLEHHTLVHHPLAKVALRAPHHYTHYYKRVAASYRHSMLQCVPYAREVSHVELTGNAFLWWAEAAGRYARGNTPVEGAVLNFRPIHRMPLGHVAVVTGVIDSRTILVTQANWVRGTITNDVTIQDVSPNNDWTDVQVELGDSRTWGAAYPTYGFIYNQPDHGAISGTTIASASSNATIGAPASEVAEAPKPDLLANDAPNRNLQ